MPLISPPTPPQLASDKAAIDESFSRAFALIEQLAADTAYLKSAETERTESLDAIFTDVEVAISDLKTANLKREAESRTLTNQVQGLKDLVPKALDGWKAAEDKKLEDLGSELRSLKLLVANRLGSGGGATSSSQPTSSSSRSYSGVAARDKPDISGPSESAPGATHFSEGLQQQQEQQQPQQGGVSRAGSGGPSKPGLPHPMPKQEGTSRYQSGGGKVKIPSWQMAATTDGKVGGGEGGGAGDRAGGGGTGGGSSTSRSGEDAGKDSET